MGTVVIPDGGIILKSNMFIDTVWQFPWTDQEDHVPRVALVVDDSMLIRHTVCRFLEERGFAAESASNGVEALEILKTLLPDLIITDLLMPKMDGNQLVEKLKASPQTKNIPIVVLKGKDSKNEAAYDPRADCAIFKDIDIVANLDGALKKIVDRPKRPEGSSIKAS
jgi:CheY-like chemotaxis protein